MDLFKSGDERFPRTGDDFQYLPARSRTPVYIPHGMELALPASPTPENYENLSTPSTSADFWNPYDRSRLTSSSTAEVNITNNTTVLVVDVPLKPIEKLKRAVKKMQRVSSRERIFYRMYRFVLRMGLVGSSDGQFNVPLFRFVVRCYLLPGIPSKDDGRVTGSLFRW